ncbi:MAG: ubiquinone/menaquinone biosynthesis methyltransferase [Dehalococcoidia bacterium]|nr:ubiquinone/menaquinone biosynthesis methyltransferase [Dehalococcoidia bacterium]
MSESIQDLFIDVPANYEIINHLLTFGQDIRWRRRVAKAAASGGGSAWLDACGGTGEMVARLSDLAPENTRIVVADFSLPMMSKALEKPESKRIDFTLADVSHLPFQDNSFDVLTIAFATRNLNTSRENLLSCFAEFNRVLKPGGRLVMLETSQPKSNIIRWFFHLYLKLVVRPVGRLISGSDAPYVYLSDSMRRFYSAEELAENIREAGFSEVSFKRFMLGAAAIHQARKGY